MAAAAGVIVIAGTGSVVYGTSENGWSCTLGGWGYLFGDEGSAFAIVRDALARMMRAHDDGDASLAAETRAVCEYFGLPSLRRLVHALYKGELTRDRVASFAPRAMASRACDRFPSAVPTGSPRSSARRSSPVRRRGSHLPAASSPTSVFATACARGSWTALPATTIVESRYEPGLRRAPARLPRCRTADRGARRMTLFERLRGGLIVSVQAWRGSALGDPQVISAMARASEANGAVAVRIAGGDHLRAVRARVELPIVGLIKREYPGFEPYITPTIDEVREIAEAGAEIVAFDATARRRPGCDPARRR